MQYYFGDSILYSLGISNGINKAAEVLKLLQARWRSYQLPPTIWNNVISKAPSYPAYRIADDWLSWVCAKLCHVEQIFAYLFSAKDGHKVQTPAEHSLH